MQRQGRLSGAHSVWAIAGQGRVRIAGSTRKRGFRLLICLIQADLETEDGGHGAYGGLHAFVAVEDAARVEFVFGEGSFFQADEAHFLFTAFFGEDFDLEIAACDVEAQGAVFQEDAGGTGKAGAVSCVGEFYVGFGQRNDDSFVMFIFSYEGMEFA